MALFHCPRCRLLFVLREGRMVQIGYDEARRMVERMLRWRAPPAPPAPARLAPAYGRPPVMNVGPGAGKPHPSVRCRPEMSDEEISRILREEYGLIVPPESVKYLRRAWWGMG
jgi:hypothetical protein